VPEVLPMTVRYLLAADPIARFQPKFDTSLRMSEELLKRGIAVDYLDLGSLPTISDRAAFLKKIPVRPILEADPSKKDFFRFGPKANRSVDEYSVILQREDPPVTESFRKHYELFFGVDVLQINRPESVLKYTEHTLPLRFPEYSIPTRIAQTPQEILKATLDFAPEAVFKPDNQCSGFGVEFFSSQTISRKAIDTYIEKWGLPVIVQPFRSVIEKLGDLRILCINEKILGSVMRVPRAGSRLANLHQGASSVAFDPTPKQLEATSVITKSLAAEGIYFVGLDFIGDEISEINITSPSALVQVNEVMGIRAQVALVDEIENLRQKKTG
jgi:glutathione synthase